MVSETTGSPRKKRYTVVLQCHASIYSVKKVRSPSGSLVRPGSLPRYLRSLSVLLHVLFSRSPRPRVSSSVATRFSSFLLFALPRVHRVRAPIDLAAPSLDSGRVLSRSRCIITAPITAFRITVIKRGTVRSSRKTAAVSSREKQRRSLCFAESVRRYPSRQQFRVTIIVFAAISPRSI